MRGVRGKIKNVRDISISVLPFVNPSVVPRAHPLSCPTLLVGIRHDEGAKQYPLDIYNPRMGTPYVYYSVYPSKIGISIMMMTDCGVSASRAHNFLCLDSFALGRCCVSPCS